MIEYDLYLSLKCAADQLASVLTSPPVIFDEYAFVARIDRVLGPMLQASVESDAGDSMPQFFTEPSRTAVAVGQCLEVVRITD